MSVEPVVRLAGSGYVVATWDRVFINIWRGAATPRAVSGMADQARLWVQELNGQRCGHLAIIESSSPAPDDRARVLLSAFFREVTANMGQPLFVAEGSGFRIAWVRGVILALSALAPQLLPFKFASSMEEASEVLEPVLTPGAGGAAGLLQAVELCRAQLRSTSARVPRP